MQKYILVTTPSFCKFSDEPIQKLESRGIKIIEDYGLKKTTTLALSDTIKSQIVGVVVGLEKISGPIMSELPKLRIIAKHGAGIDNIDVEAASKNNIEITRVPGANAVAVAEATIGQIFNLSRSLALADRSLREGNWNRYYGDEINGKTLSIIGFGAIGKEVCKRAESLGMSVVVNDITLNKEIEARFVSFEEAMKLGDYISIHLPLLDSTYHIIDSKKINMMKQNAYLINFARGGLINDEDLIDALKSNRIAGAALDAFENEPKVDSRYLELENVVLTPHLGGFSKEALNKISKKCVEDILEVVND